MEGFALARGVRVQSHCYLQPGSREMKVQLTFSFLLSPGFQAKGWSFILLPTSDKLILETPSQSFSGLSLAPVKLTQIFTVSGMHSQVSTINSGDADPSFQKTQDHS